MSVFKQLAALATKIKTQWPPIKAQILSSAYAQNAKQHWQQLSQRERQLLQGTGVFLLLVIFYVMIYLPLTDSTQQYQQDIINQQETLTFVRMAAPRILAAKGETKAVEPLTQDKLLPTIEETLKSTGLMEVVAELSLNNQQAVDVQFNQVEFDVLVQWVVDLRQQHGVQIRQFSAVPVDTPGFVNASIELAL